MILRIYRNNIFYYITVKITNIFHFVQQIKRKIADVSRKLEVLYDCLRENKVCISLCTVLLSI